MPDFPSRSMHLPSFMSFNHSAMPSKLPNDAAMPELHREFKASLPNELPFAELQNIVATYITDNFIKYHLCAISAIHEGQEIYRTLPKTTSTYISSFQHALSSPAVSAKKRSRTRQAPVYPALARAMGQRTKRSLCTLRPRYPGQSRKPRKCRVSIACLPFTSAVSTGEKNSEANAHPLEIENVPSNRENKMRELCQKPHLPYYDLDYTR